MHRPISAGEVRQGLRTFPSATGTVTPITLAGKLSPNYRMKLTGRGHQSARP